MARRQVAASVMPDGPEVAAGGSRVIAATSDSDGTSPRSPADRTDQPAVAGLIALLAALGFALAAGRLGPTALSGRFHPGREAFRDSRSAAVRRARSRRPTVTTASSSTGWRSIR